MSSKHKHEKKTNVINRTTSETLRLGESDLRVLPQSASSSLSIQSLPQSRKKIQNSSSSFQITGVSMTRLDFGDDSADDLDESHTDDISRVTDNETPSFSEDSRDTDDHPIYEPAIAPATTLMIATEPLQTEVKPKPPDEDAGARFKVVKMPSATPFSRGRWTCFDYLDNSEPNLNYIHSDQKFVKHFDNNQVARPPSQATHVQGQGSSKFPSVNYNQPLMTTDVQMESLFRDNSFLAYISPHYTVQQNTNTVVANKPAGTMKSYPQGYSSILCEGIQASDGIKFSETTQIPGQEIISEQNRKAATQPSNVNGQKDDVLSDIKVALTSTPASNSGSAPNNNNIDRKIEEALDAVKTHLMVAVHKEVDFLKTRVSTLEGRVNELEIENSILRVNYLLFKS